MQCKELLRIDMKKRNHPIKNGENIWIDILQKRKSKWSIRNSVLLVIRDMPIKTRYNYTLTRLVKNDSQYRLETVTWYVLRWLQFYSPLLLYHKWECPQSEKGMLHLSIMIEENSSNFSDSLTKSLGPLGVHGPHCENCCPKPGDTQELS